MPQTYTEYVPCAKHLLDPKETMNKTDFLVWRIRSLGRLTEKMILALGPEVIALDRQDKQDTGTPGTGATSQGKKHCHQGDTHTCSGSAKNGVQARRLARQAREP